MDYKQIPVVTKSFPGRASENVPVHLKEFYVEFNIALDDEFIAGNAHLERSDGIRIPCTISYDHDKRRIYFRLNDNLQNGTEYRMSIRGDINHGDAFVTGIRSVFGTPMDGGDIVYFKTEAVILPSQPALSKPEHLSLIKDLPTFEWTGEASTFEIQVSDDPAFAKLKWGKSDSASGVAFPAALAMEEGMYHWRVRGITEDGKQGPWSNLSVFAYSTAERAPVAPDDTLPPEVSYDPAETGYIEFLDSFPMDGFSNVATNLKTISFRVLGDVKAEDVDFSLYGESIFGDEADHGELVGTVETVKEEGYTRVIVTLPVQ